MGGLPPPRPDRVRQCRALPRPVARVAGGPPRERWGAGRGRSAACGRADAAPRRLRLLRPGGAPLRQDLYPWLFIKLAEYRKESQEEDSPFGRIGLWAATDLGVAPLTKPETLAVIAGLASNARLSGRCRTEHIGQVVVGGRETEITVPYCPRDCLAEDALSSRARAVTVEGEPLEELERACRSARDAGDAIAGSSRRARVKACLSEFGDTNRSFLGCLVETSASPHPIAFPGLAAPEPSQEFAIARRCQLTRGGEGPRSGHIDTDTDTSPRDDGGWQWWRRSTHFDADGDRHMTVLVGRDFGADGEIEASWYQVIDYENGTSTTVHAVGRGRREMDHASAALRRRPPEGFRRVPTGSTRGDPRDGPFS